MGMHDYGKSSSSYDNPQQGNPDPSKYKIKKSIQVKKNLVVKIKYPDCENYEGNKILIYKNANINDLWKQDMIDPHFSEDKRFLSPFARFEPTIKGWEKAVKIAKMI